MREGIEFKTDVIRPFSTEQRIRLVDVPRRSFNHEYMFTPEEYERARAIMRGRHPASMDLPDWALRNTASVASGASAITFDNTYPTLTDGDRAVLLQDSGQYEEIFISGGDASGVTLSAPVEGTYRNAILAPLISAFTMDGLEVDHSSVPMRPGQAEWMCFEGTDVSDDSAFGTYRGEPLLTLVPRPGDSSFKEVISHAFEAVDSGLGVPFFDTTIETATQSLGMAWQVESRQAQWELRQLLYSLKGRQRALWLPDWNNGITLAASASNGATALIVRDFGFAEGYESGDLFIHLKSGTVITRQITESVDNGNGTETLTISPGLPQAVAAADIATFSLLFHVRMSSDKAIWEHRSSPGAKVTAAVQEAPIT